jgi:hypothetical protein
MSCRLSKPGLRREEEISTLFFVNKSEKCADHGKIIFIFHKTTLHLNWCGVFEPFKARNEFRHSVPINQAESTHVSNYS